MPELKQKMPVICLQVLTLHIESFSPTQPHENASKTNTYHFFLKNPPSSFVFLILPQKKTGSILSASHAEGAGPFVVGVFGVRARERRKRLIRLATASERRQEQEQDSCPNGGPAIYSYRSGKMIELVRTKHSFRRLSLGRPVNNLGEVFVTRAGEAALKWNDFQTAVDRFAALDWGEVTAEESVENIRGLKQGLGLFGRYDTVGGTEFWITSTGKQRTTLVSLPSDA